MSSEDDIPTVAHAELKTEVLPRRLLHYVIKESLGEGGMGQVFLAHDEKVRRDVALKFLAPRLKNDQVAKKRFEREAQAAARITHPNVVKILNFERVGDEQIIVSEYIPGTNLSALIRRGRIALDVVVGVLQQVAAGLAAAHAKGVIHRDLKPANIRVTPEHFVVIVDFGLGKFVVSDPEDPTQIDITEKDAHIGTTPYMAPERLRSEDVSTPSDVFSFGVIAYELLTGARPFDRPSPTAIVAAILAETPPDVRTIRPDVSNELATLVNMCLEKDFVKRPSADMLARYLSGTQSGVSAGKEILVSRLPSFVDAPSIILSSEFPDYDWFASHRNRAFTKAETVAAATMEMKAAYVSGGPPSIGVAELFAGSKKVQRDQSPSYVGRVFDDDRYRPRRGEDDIYAEISFSHSDEYCYWATRRTGDTYQLAMIAPKGNSGRLVIELLMREFIAGLQHVNRTAELVHASVDAELLVQVHLRGIRDRLLVGNNPNWAFSSNLSMWGYHPDVDEAVSTARLSVASLRNDLRNVVEKVFGDLIAYFSFAVVPSNYYDYAVDAMMQYQ